MATETIKKIEPGADGLLASLVPTPAAKPHIIQLDIAPAAIGKILFTLAGAWLLIRIFPVLILITLSLMLVATFNPLVRRLQARLGRSWAIVGVVTLLVGVFLGTLALLIPPLIYEGLNVLKNAPMYARQIEQMLAAHHIHLKLQQQVQHFTSNASDAMPEVMSILASVIRGTTAFVTVAILTIYLLIEGPQVGMSMIRLLPRKDRLGMRKLVMEIGVQVGGYMRGQIITSGLAGLFSFVTLWIIGVPEALALGALAAIADAIPIIGLLIALLPAALMALTLSSAKAGIVVVAYLIYHQLESNFIGPKVYGNTLGMSLSVIVISLLIGVELMGMLGAVLALPVAAAIPSILRYIQEWQETHSEAEPETALP